MENNINYLKYSRTEMYYSYIAPIKEILYTKSLSTEDKLIEINKLIYSFYEKAKNNPT